MAPRKSPMKVSFLKDFTLSASIVHDRNHVDFKKGTQYNCNHLYYVNGDPKLKNGDVIMDLDDVINRSGQIVKRVSIHLGEMGYKDIPFILECDKLENNIEQDIEVTLIPQYDVESNI